MTNVFFNWPKFIQSKVESKDPRLHFINPPSWVPHPFRAFAEWVG